MKLVNKISKLSGNDSKETYHLLREHRKFIQDLLKDQNLSSRARKEFTALQSNQTIWEMEWEELSKTFGTKTGHRSSSNISTFFNSRSVIENDLNTIDSSDSSSSNNLVLTTKKNNNFDETSSLLSISDDESATYIEYPTEPTKEKEIDSNLSINIFEYLKSSFTSLRLVEWKLSECYSFQKSFYTCPVCKITFKTDRKDCISSFTIHIRAHLADYESNDAIKTNNSCDEYLVHSNSNFEIRFSNFRNDLQQIVAGKNVYNPILMKFDKHINNPICSVIDQPFKKYTALHSIEMNSVYPIVNPIKALKFKPSVAISSVQTSKAQPTQILNESTISNAAPLKKKPRAKKSPVPKLVADTVASAAQKDEVSAVSSNDVAPPLIESKPVYVKLILNNKLLKPQSVVTIANSGENSSSFSSIADQNQSQNSKIASSAQSLNFLSSNIFTSKSVVEIISDRDEQPNANLLLSDRSKLDNPISIPNVLEISNNQTKLQSDIPVDIDIISYDALVPVPLTSDLIRSYSVNGSQLGCSHLKVNCKFFAECCDKWFSCQFCHDTSNNHQVNRLSTRFCLCMFCGTSQMASSRCVNPKCESLLAQYYCDICKLWDNDTSKLIYHCDKCNKCRIGLRSNYKHCEACDKQALSLKTHKIINTSNLNIPSVDFLTHESQSSLKSNLNFSYSPSEKKQKIDNTYIITPLIGNPRTSTIEFFDNSSSIDQTNYVNSLKNSLDNEYSRNKSTLFVASKPINSCWNCLNTLPTDSKSKYCLNCSAVIE